MNSAALLGFGNKADTAAVLAITPALCRKSARLPGGLSAAVLREASAGGVAGSSAVGSTNACGIKKIPVKCKFGDPDQT